METITLIITIIFYIYLVVFFCHILWRSRKIDWDLKYYYFGIASYIILFVISQSIFVINELLYTNGSDSVPQKSWILYIIANFIGQMAIFGIMIVVEKYIFNKMHYIPSIITLISAILILIFPKFNNTSIIIIYILIGALMGALIPIIYIIVGFQVSGKARVKSFIIGLGLIIFIVGVLLNTYFLLNIIPIFAIIAPIIQFIGMAIFHYGFLVYYQASE